jgi:hypothetical protein
MNTILSLGIGTIFIGVFGYIFEMVGSGAQGIMFVPFLMIVIDTSPPEAVALLVDIMGTMIRTTSLMMVCILTTMVTALLWFGLESKINKIEQAEVVFLLDDS